MSAREAFDYYEGVRKVGVRQDSATGSIMVRGF